MPIGSKQTLVFNACLLDIFAVLKCSSAQNAQEFTLFYLFTLNIL